MNKRSSDLQMTLVAGRRAGVVQVSHRVLERLTHVIFCFWTLLLSSSAVEAQHCLRRRSPCVCRWQRDQGPSLLALKKPRAAACALAAMQQRCRVYRGLLLLALKTPCVHCAEDAHASIVGSAVKATRCSRTSLLSFCRRLPSLPYNLRYHITGPASLADIGKLHVKSYDA